MSFEVNASLPYVVRDLDKRGKNFGLKLLISLRHESIMTYHFRKILSDQKSNRLKKILIDYRMSSLHDQLDKCPNILKSEFLLFN